MKNVKSKNRDLLTHAYNKAFHTIEEKRPAYKISIYYDAHFEEFTCKISSSDFSSTITIFDESSQKYLDKLCNLAESFVNEMYE